MSAVRFHGPELDAALAAVPPPVEMEKEFGICLTALDSRTSDMVDRQMDNVFARPPEEVRAELRAEGMDVSALSDLDLLMITMRSVIGGTFTYALGAGYRLGAGLVGAEGA
jgi:hypothetical protein